MSVAVAAFSVCAAPIEDPSGAVAGRADATGRFLAMAVPDPPPVDQEQAMLKALAALRTVATVERVVVSGDDGLAAAISAGDLPVTVAGTTGRSHRAVADDWGLGRR